MKFSNSITSIVYFFAALLVVGVISCNRSGAGDEFIVFPVQKGEFVVFVKCQGEIIDKQEALVNPPDFEWTYTIEDMVQDGTKVKKGDFLIQLDTSMLEIELSDLKLKLESQEADFKKLKALQAEQRMSRKNNLAI